MFGDNEKCMLSGSMYGNTMSWESKHPDCTADDFLDALYGIMIGLSFQPQTIIRAMSEFVECHSNDTETVEDKILDDIYEDGE